MPNLYFVLDDGETYSEIAYVVLVTDETESRICGGEYSDPSNFEDGDVLMSSEITDALKDTMWDVNHESSPKTHEEAKTLIEEWNKKYET